MAQSKKSKKPAGRKLSRLSTVGDEASKSARRALLLTTCEIVSWDLSAAARALELATSADVIRALRELAPDEYEAARESGKIRRGRPAE